MATSLLFNINKFIILEYIYSDLSELIQYSTSTMGFRRVTNGHQDNEDIIINEDSARTITRNVIDDTVVELDNAKYALLDNDSAFFYPNVDPEITVSDITIAPVLNVIYDKVRIHIMSGYNFEELDGFIISLYARMNNDKKLRFIQFSHHKSDTSRLFFNPKPLKLAEFIYDKFVEFEVPAQAFMLNQQEASPQSATTLSYYLTNGIYLANQKTIYAEFKNIKRTISKEGLIFFEPADAVNFAFNSVDKFDLLVAQIKESDDGDYFEYYAEWDGNLIEDFIFQLNSVAGNNFFIIHELRVTEQVGQTFLETDNFTKIQTSNYDQLNRFRPILQLSSSAVSFSLEYTVRLYNSTDGRSIFKVSSLTSMDINKYGEKTTKLNVGGITQPLKIYNKLFGRKEFSIQDNLTKLTNTKILTTFLDNTNILVSSDNDIDNSIVGMVIQITPFDNLYKFNLSKRDDPNSPNSRIAIDLDTVSEYFMVFLKNDDSKLYIKEFKSINFKKQEGEIGFKLNKQESAIIGNITKNDVFYVITRNPDGIETVIFSASFRIDQDRLAKDRIPTTGDTFTPIQSG